MAEGYEDKTTFFTGEGVFCYRKMPFGIKNAGATYQRLVDKVFHDQIERNLEAYPNDMGIRANPSKVKAITDVEQLKMFKDVHSLNGKIAALIRFLSKGTKRYLPFFKVLKSCTDKKNIQWTQEAKAALKKIKKFVEILSTLMAPIQGEGSEFNYPGMEKLILALTLTKPKKSGRVAKWAIELGEHDIVFQERGDETPKDFQIEVPLENNKKEAEEKADTKPMKRS
ncbi:hypothetical protein Tco_0175422 [Tanacetum coccineum]